ncbi:MAG: hypothetical protein ACLFN5_05575 [bacterium]
MGAQRTVYYRTYQDVPTRGEAVSVYECELENNERMVKRFATHIPETGDYDRLNVDWAMVLCHDDAQEVSREEFDRLWELELPEE